MTGVHIDVAGQHYCGCARCEEGFRAYLSARYRPAQMKDLFGTADPEKLRQPPLKTSWLNPTLLDVERERYQIGLVTTSFWDAVRAGGEQVLGKGRFWIHASDEGAREYYTGHNNSLMFEETERFVGLMEREILPGVFHNRYGSLIFEYKSDQGYAVLPPDTRTRAACGILNKNRSFGEYSVRLGIAEGAAYTSGGGGFSTFSPGYVFDIMRAFFAQHADLYQGFTGAGTIGLYQNSENRIILYNHEEHISASTRTADHFLEKQVPFDFIPRAAASPRLLARYPVIAALSLVQLETLKLKELADYAEQGGCLIVDDRFALEDEFMRQRDRLPWGGYAGKSPYDIRFGKGRIISLKAPVQGEEVATAVEQALERLPVLAQEIEGLRTNVLARKTGRQTDITVHLLNYNVPLVEGSWNIMGSYVKEPCKPKPIGPISVVLPVPKGARVVSVDVLTPDFEITPKC